MVTLQNKKTGEKRTWDTDNADVVARLVRVGWVVVGEGLPPEVGPRPTGRITPKPAPKKSSFIGAGEEPATEGEPVAEEESATEEATPKRKR